MKVKVEDVVKAFGVYDKRQFGIGDTPQIFRAVAVLRQAAVDGRWAAIIQKRIARRLKEGEAEYQEYETTRQDLVKKHGVKDGDSENYNVPPDKIEAFRVELQPVLDEEVELTGDPIAIPSDAEGLDMIVLEMLEPMFVVKE